jgi:hypothetical protein
MPLRIALLALLLAFAACERSDSRSSVDGLHGEGGSSPQEGAFTRSPVPRVTPTP